MKKLLLILGVCLVAFSSCKKESSLSKESSGSNTEDWTVFTVAYDAPIEVYFKDFLFYLKQSSSGTTIVETNGSWGYGGVCLVDNVEALGKIEDFDDLSYQERILLYDGACAVEKFVCYKYDYNYGGFNYNEPYTAYTAFIIEDWETNAMLGRYKLIQVKYPNGEIYPEPID